MPRFSYVASDENNEKVEGDLDAANVSDAVAALQKRGLSVESITLMDDQPEPRSVNATQPDEQVAQFDASWSQTRDRCMETIWNHRTELVAALQALVSEIPKGHARIELERLAKVLTNATSPDALRGDPLVLRWLPTLVSSLDSPTSESQLGNLVSRMLHEAEARTLRRRLLAYPVMVLVISTLIVLALCAIVVPTFSDMMEGFGMSLPTPTRMLIWVSDTVTGQPLQTLLVVTLSGLAMYIALRLWVRYAWTTRLFGRLVAGNSANLSAMSSFTAQLANLLEIGVALPDALWLAGRFCQHHYFQLAAQQLARDADRGDRPLAESPVADAFPGNLIFALQSNPHDPSHITLLRSLSEMYSDRVVHRVDWTTGAVAQFAIVAIGLVIAAIVIALFAPLTQLISGLT